VEALAAKPSELNIEMTESIIEALKISNESLSAKLEAAVSSIDCAVRYLESTGIDKPENDWDPEFQMLRDLRKTLSFIKQKSEGGEG